MYTSRYYIPTLVCFYASWAPQVLPYLNAFHRALDDLCDLGVSVRFALMELSGEMHQGE